MSFFGEGFPRRTECVREYTLTNFICHSNDNAVSDEHVLYSQLNQRSLFTHERMGESVGFGPVLRSRDDCLNVLLLFKII